MSASSIALDDVPSRSVATEESLIPGLVAAGNPITQDLSAASFDHTEQPSDAGEVDKTPVANSVAWVAFPAPPMARSHALAAAASIRGVSPAALNGADRVTPIGPSRGAGQASTVKFAFDQDV